MLALARSSGANSVVLIDYNQFRLDFAKKYGDFEALNAEDGSLKDSINDLTEKRGADISIVATGNSGSYPKWITSHSKRWDSCSIRSSVKG